MSQTQKVDLLTSVNAHELDLVGRLLAAVAPAEDGRYPGVQLSLTRSASGRQWTITDGATTVDVRSTGAIRGLDESVWLPARCIEFALLNDDRFGWWSIAIDDRRRIDGTATALINGPLVTSRFDLPDPPPVTLLRPPVPTSVIATASTDVSTLVRVARAAALTPVGVPVSGPPVGTFEIDHGVLLVHGADRRGVDLPAEFRIEAETERHLDPAIDYQVRVGLTPLIEIGEQLPRGEVIVTLTTTGELWIVAGWCRVVLRGETRRLEPDEVEGIVYVVGRVQDTGEAVLSLHGSCPVDGITVWLESRPDDCGPLEWLEQDHDILWDSEPQSFGVIVPSE